MFTALQLQALFLLGLEILNDKRNFYRSMQPTAIEVAVNYAWNPFGAMDLGE
ncbi:MAG: hypothetical protein VCF07_05780 [Nitrospinota bacterium]